MKKEKWNGAAGEETTQVIKKLASLQSTKSGIHYAVAIRNLRNKIGFCLLRSSITLLRGVRFNATFYSPSAAATPVSQQINTIVLFCFVFLLIQLFPKILTLPLICCLLKLIKIKKLLLLRLNFFFFF